MASIVKLVADDSRFNSAIKKAANAFSTFIGKIANAKGAFDSLTRSINMSNAAQNALNTSMRKNIFGAFSGLASDLLNKLVGVGNEEEKLTGRTNELAESTRKLNESIASGAAESMTKYTELKIAYESLQNSHEKTEWIKKNAKAFRDLGLQVTDVKSAEDVFYQNTNNVVDGFKKRAEAAALAARMTELYKQKMTLEQQAVDRTNKIEVKPYDTVSERVENNFFRDESGNTYNKGLYGYNQGKFYFTEKGAQEYNKQLWESDKTLKDIDLEWQNVNKSIDSVTNKLKDLGTLTPVLTPGSDTGGGKTTSPNEKPVKKITTQTMTEYQQLEAMLKNIESSMSLYGKASAEWKAMNGYAEVLRYQIKLMNGELEKAPGPLLQMERAAEKIREQMKNPIDEEEFQTLKSNLEIINAEIKKFKGESTTKASKSKNQYVHTNEDNQTYTKINEVMGGVASGMSQMVSGIEQLGIDLPQGMKDVISGIQGVASILTGISAIVSVIEALSAANAIIPFSTGGIVHAANGFAGTVPGRSYSGDNVPILANAGEVVLTRAMAGTLASELTEAGGSGGYTPSYISGEQIYIALNRYAQRTGRGEKIMWKN